MNKLTITEGKLKALDAVSDARGVIRAAAMDQRGSLQKSIAKAKGIDAKQVTFQMMSEFKVAVSKALTPHASAILLDPEFGLEAARQRDKKAGLLLAYEKTGYEQATPGRLPLLIDGYSARRLKKDGADCVKVLLYYTPFEEAAINQKKHLLMEQIGQECVREDIPFFLEFVGYDPKGADGKDLAYAKQKPEIVIGSMKEFSKEKYHVDVLKVEIPIEMKFTSGTKVYNGKEAAYTRDETKKIFQRQSVSVTKPFIYLSAGVGDDEFRESLELAIEAGADFAGVLCGRATWKEGIPEYAKGGVDALTKWLSQKGVKNIKALNQVLDKGARPWFSRYGGRDNIQVKALTV